VNLLATASADWITLDGGAMLLILIAWGLGAASGFCGVVCLAAASLAPKQARAGHARRAVFCLALAPMLALALPVVFETFPRATRDVIAASSLIWVPIVIGSFGWLVHRLGRSPGSR
jgi:hypothetical protein